MFSSGANNSNVWDNVTRRGPWNDRLGAARLAPALHLGNRRATDPADGCAVDHAHDRRHLPRDRHPSRAGGLELQRAHHRGHGTSRRVHHRTRLFHYGQRHLAHRIQIDPQHRSAARLLPARHRDRWRNRADHRGEQHHPADHSARHAATGGDPVQCLERACGADDAVQQDADRATDLRLQPEFHPGEAVHHPGPCHARAVRRQVTADQRRHRPGAAAGQGLCSHRCRVRPAGFQRHRPGGHRADWRPRIQRAVELEPERGRSVQRSADRCLQWRDRHIG